MNLIEEKIISLIENKHGDSVRLNELLERVRSKKKIYDSDINYIEKLSPTTKTLPLDSSRGIPPISPNKTDPPISSNTTTKNIRSVNCGFGITYNIRYRDEVKIHANYCHNYSRASQAGPTKWKFASNLKESVSIAQKLSSNYGPWKFPKCCGNHNKTYFECNNCQRYSDHSNNTHKIHSTKIRIISICLLVFPILFMLTRLEPRLNGLGILLVLIGIILLVIENIIAPEVCNNCESKNFKRVKF